MIPGAVWDRLLKTERAARSGLVGSGAAASPLARWACLAALAIVVLWNGLDVLGSTRAPRAFAAMRPVVNASGLRQSWQLFSEPAKFEAWFVYQGRLKTGNSVDLLRGVPLAPGEAFPKCGQEFANHRWRKLHLRVAQEGYAAYRQPLAEAVFRSWNDRHSGDEQAAHLKIVCIRRRADASDPAGGVIQFNLATVGGDSYQGNFADALREFEN
jgi:hypothetical protein